VAKWALMRPLDVVQKEGRRKKRLGRRQKINKTKQTRSY